MVPIHSEFRGGRRVDAFRRFLCEAELAAGGVGVENPEILRQLEERFSTLIARPDTQE